MNGGRNGSKTSATTSVEVVTAMTSKTPIFSGNHSDDCTIWEMKMSAHLMEKGLEQGPAFT